MLKTCTYKKNLKQHDVSPTSLKSILDIFNLANCCKEKVYLSINAQESLQENFVSEHRRLLSVEVDLNTLLIFATSPTDQSQVAIIKKTPPNTSELNEIKCGRRALNGLNVHNFLATSISVFHQANNLNKHVNKSRNCSAEMVSVMRARAHFFVSRSSRILLNFPSNLELP